MSRVQSPKAQTQSQLPEATRETAADFGPWTLDSGLPTDSGLSVNDLRKSFQSPTGDIIEVLRGVSFSASTGESIAIVGSSGAGKTTLLQLLGGLESPDHGTVVAGQFAIEKAGPSALARFRNQRVGFVFQNHNLLPDLTAAENIALPLLIARVHSREAKRRAEAMLDKVGLRDRAAHPVGSLSGGEQQRVAVCRALITQPAIVLADEPTGNLDAANADELADALFARAGEAQAIIILATHNQSLAARCDRVFKLSDGRLSTS
ncbi:MAG TPA: ABC transporter ATP-binding protein [Pyrinomonadaceae bacterium]|nr:ABC transporter ATP-binding protein [Pyrinomonadaceae bacterium]